MAEQNEVEEKNMLVYYLSIIILSKVLTMFTYLELTQKLFSQHLFYLQ